ncbi:hypothetical protein J2S43_001342 [Catenuloplanes nepalensis]|uniref:FXSXX-COOH protein n=1 Tax=Catenuloplanes nepalensis TaxID=587533 RepID=A0ABT9MN21_9ACTN|nr:hypothetical protein [Catenuloplanes nepalensis]MDP9792830.1 hypothetical protein [Catenuloplanes nepalensis]
MDKPGEPTRDLPALPDLSDVPLDEIIDAGGVLGEIARQVAAEVAASETVAAAFTNSP